jgi:hypothetical protein
MLLGFARTEEGQAAVIEFWDNAKPSVRNLATSRELTRCLDESHPTDVVRRRVFVLEGLPKNFIQVLGLDVARFRTDGLALSQNSMTAACPSSPMEPSCSDTTDVVRRRVFVLEGLPKNFIQVLGARLKVPPAFFSSRQRVSSLDVARFRTDGLALSQNSMTAACPSSPRPCET